MPTTKETLNRIQGVAATKQITQAMKMVAVARMGKATAQLTHLQCYDATLEQTFTHLVTGKETISSPYMQPRKGKRILLMLLTSDKGLCGAYNHHILQHTLQAYQAWEAQGKVVDLLPAGQQALKFLQRHALPYIPDYVGLVQHPAFYRVQQCAKGLMKSFIQGDYEAVFLLYQPNRHSTTEGVVHHTLIPFKGATAATPPPDAQTLYLPGRQVLAEALLPQLVALRLHRALLLGAVAEQSARMIAMSQATDNADKLLKELHLTYNRTRQANITRAISEIAASTQALR